MAETNAGILPIDLNRRPIQVASNIQTRDATATALESPRSVAATTVPLVIPVNAVVLHVRAVGADLRYGDNTDLDTGAGEGYGLIPDGGSINLPCANGGTIFFVQDAGATVTMYFHFEMLIA